MTLSSPSTGLNTGQVSAIRLGLFDVYSGIDRASLSVVANFAVNGKDAGSDFVTLNR